MRVRSRWQTKPDVSRTAYTTMTTSISHGYRHDYQPGPHPLTADERRVNVPLRLRGEVAERLKSVPKRARFVEAAVVDALDVAEFDVFREFRVTESS